MTHAVARAKDYLTQRDERIIPTKLPPRGLVTFFYLLCVTYLFNMSDKALKWGCCTNESVENFEEKSIKCSSCGKSYHYACMSLKEPPSKLGTSKTWKCPTCLNSTPKVHKDDSTPIRNISMTRGPKRQAVSPPSPPAIQNDRDETHSIIRDIIKEELNEMLTKFNTTITTAINKELEPIKKEIEEIKESMFFMNEKFEDIKKEQQSSKESIKKLESENTELKVTVEELHTRINNLEQQARSNNLEVQCVPENKNENVYNVITQLSRVVNCELNEKDILHCTRVAKTNVSSSRPRSIIVQLTSPRVRDQLLAATIKYNKSNPQDKLNCSHLGYAGSKSPVFVTEHLSPTNRALHAATRIKAKEKRYKYVWVRNGRIFVRKEDGSETILIKNNTGLNKIV